MTERSFGEMIAYFNRRVAGMDINPGDKMELLGMVAALGFKHEKSEPQWIPCSERLPKQGQEVICQCRASIIKVLKLNANGDWYQDAMHCYMSGFVIAWMPLPEPYKQDVRGDDHEISYGGFITTDDMLDFGYESVEDLAVAFAEFLKNNMRGDDHA